MRLLQRALPAAVSLAVLLWLLRSVDLGAVGASLAPRSLLVLVPSFLAYGAATLWLEAYTLSRLARAHDALPLWTAARIKCASYLLALVHYALGAGALTLLLRRRGGLPLARAASLVLLVSVTDLVVVLALAAGGAALVGTGAPTARAGLVAAAALGVFGGMALLRTPRPLGPLERLRRLPVFDALRRVPAPDLALLLGLRVVFVLCFVGICKAAFVAFGIAVPAPAFVAGVLTVALVGALPIAVAGLGTTQAAFVYLFAPFALRETILAMSLVLSAGMVLLRALMGVAFAREFTREALRATRAAEP